MISDSSLYRMIRLSYRIMSPFCLAVFSMRPFSNAFWALRSGYGLNEAAPPRNLFQTSQLISVLVLREEEKKKALDYATQNKKEVGK